MAIVKQDTYGTQTSGNKGSASGKNPTAAAASAASKAKVSQALPKVTNAYVNYNTPSSPSGGGGGGSVTSYDLSSYYKSLLDSARNSELEALLANFNYAKDQYNSQMDDVWDQAQAQINANQVNRYTSKGAIREALANRGQLDSGLGRQEALNQRIQYDNMDNSIKNSRNKSINQIKSAITKLEADYKNNVANVNSNYALQAASL